MKITIISGSHRVNSESERVSRFIERQITTQFGAAGIAPAVVNLAENPLPLWDEGMWKDDPKWKSSWGPIAKGLQESDGFVVVSPEWAGMVPSGLKNFFLLCSNREVAHKPAMIVGVSSGIGGAYPVAELRTSSYKNNRIVYIPDHVIVRSVNEMLKGETPANDHDAGIRKRISYSLAVLVEYAKAMKHIRESGVINTKDYPFGM